MRRFVLARLFQALVTLLLASFVVFTLARLSGNPADMLLPVEATPAERESYVQRLGLDQPLVYQYWVYLQSAASGDFGVSLRNKTPVAELVRERLLNSVGLASAAMLFTLLLSVPLGVVAAVYRDRLWDRVAMVIALLGQSLPSFWSGIVLILIFSVMLKWLPTSGIGDWRHLVLPAVTMGWFTSAAVVRLLRSGMLEVLDSEYIKLARAKGLQESLVIWKHGLRNALIVVVTFLGYMYGIMIAVSVSTEVVFSWPGLGRLAYEALLTRDFPVLQFTILMFTVIMIVVNFSVDMLYLILDPRIRT